MTKSEIKVGTLFHFIGVNQFYFILSVKYLNEKKPQITKVISASYLDGRLQCNMSFTMEQMKKAKIMNGKDICFLSPDTFKEQHEVINTLEYFQKIRNGNKRKTSKTLKSRAKTT